MSSFFIVVLLVIFGLAGIRIADQYVRGVVFRLGRYHTTKGPGLYWIIPLIEWQRRLAYQHRRGRAARNNHQR
jgi:regulator of protease activity HflC (stomatin/prohibitin superfamily)